MSETIDPELLLRPAARADVPLIMSFVRALAEYERLADQVVGTEDDMRRALFPAPGDLPAPCQPAAEVVIAELGGEPVGFALFFHNMSTFLARRGLYLEDLFVLPSARGRGVGRALLAHLARIARDRECGRMEWSVLDWNEPAIRLYKSLGAVAMEEWTVFRLTGDALLRLAGDEASSG